MQDLVVHLVFGSQLFPIEILVQPFPDPKKVHFFMAETEELCRYYRFHKHKLILFLASMREYRDALKTRGYRVHYIELSDEPYQELLEQFIRKQKPAQLAYWEIEDKFMEERVSSLFQTAKLSVQQRPSPMFLHTRTQFTDYLKSVKKPLMKTFYERSRKHFNILMDAKGKPLGGQFSFDEDNRKKLPKDIEIAERRTLTASVAQSSKHVQAVTQLVNERFPDHPGNSENFWIPTTRKQWIAHLDEFAARFFDRFGDYEDAISTRDPFLFHSVLSPGLNLGLITPRDVLERALLAKTKSKPSTVPLNAVEGFVRQVLGWREFVRGIYQSYSTEQETTNFWDHRRPLTSKWYQATTGIPPIDDAIKKANQYGYNHHIERLMILSNAMLLSEIDPKHVHRWFMEMYVDSSDWVMGPNVYGMGQFSDGGIFATKPYICGSNYILKMSDYKKGEWCEVMDSLYWTFISKHRSFYGKNPRMSVMVKSLDKMKPAKMSRMMLVAENFRKS